MLTVLQQYVEQNVVLALSGGSDSVGMLRALLDVGVKVYACHINHRLRPSAYGDAEFVAALCEEHAVPLYTVTVDVARIAQKRKKGIEETARVIRYQQLSHHAKTVGAGTIITAHTLNDQAETVLMQMLRGTHAPVGMAALRGHVHRPWLSVPKEEIRQYLHSLGQTWCEDPSNLDTRYTRNWVRQVLIPLLQEKNPNITHTLARLAQYTREDDTVLNGIAQSITEYSHWGSVPVSIQRRLIAKHLPTAQHLHIAQIQDAVRQHSTQYFTVSGQEITVSEGKIQHPRVYPKPPPSEGLTLRSRENGDVMRLKTGTRKLSDILNELKIPRTERDSIPVLAKSNEVVWLGLPTPLHAGDSLHPERYFMQQALKQARQAAQQGEVPIGAVLVHHNTIIASAHNTCQQQQDFTQHAELKVLQQAGKKAIGAVLYVTLEPCPMCVGAMLEARVTTVVYGCANTKMGALGGVYDLGRHHFGHTLQVKSGVLAQQCSHILEDFFAQQRTAKT